jgi:hypothetical protein
MGLTTKAVGKSSQASWSEDVAFLSAKELKTARALIQAEAKSAPKMRSARAADVTPGDDTPIRARYLSPPTIKYLKPPTKDMWTIMTAVTNAVMDGKKVTKDEVSLLKKVFNKVIADNPGEKKAIQNFLFKVVMNVHETAPKTAKGVFTALYAEDGPLHDYNKKPRIYAIVPPMRRPTGVIPSN